MNQTAQHCFLLDGKTILPIDRNYQLLIPLQIINHIKSLDENIKSMNNNKYCQVDEEDLCSSSLQSITKLFEDKRSNDKIFSRKIATAKRSYCKHHQSDQKLNNTETYLITRIIPSISSDIDSTNKQLHKSSSPITIIIKPVISSENHQKLSRNKRKNSSSSSSLKSTSNQALNNTFHKHRLSTFKDLTRPVSTAMILNENPSSPILNPRTLLDIYRNKKQNII